MIRQKNDPWEIDQQFDWEERDCMVGDTLNVENEQNLLGMARDIRTSIMQSNLSVPPEEVNRVLVEMSYLRGKYDLLLQLVENSKEAKLAAHLAQTT